MGLGRTRALGLPYRVEMIDVERRQGGWDLGARNHQAPSPFPGRKGQTGREKWKSNEACEDEAGEKGRRGECRSGCQKNNVLQLSFQGRKKEKGWEEGRIAKATKRSTLGAINQTHTRSTYCQ